MNMDDLSTFFETVQILNQPLSRWLIVLGWLLIASLISQIIYLGFQYWFTESDDALDKKQSRFFTLFYPLRAIIFIISLYQAFQLFEIADVDVAMMLNQLLRHIVIILSLWFILELAGIFVLATYGLYAIINRTILLLAVAASFVFLLRAWILIPLACRPNCISQPAIGADLVELDLHRTELIGANLREADLSGSDLSGVDMSRANLSSANLRGANLSNATLIGANLQGADLRGVILDNTDLSGADLSQANLTKTDLRLSRLHGVLFDKAIIVEANLDNVDLAGVIMSNAVLTGSSLRHVKLSGALLSGSDLSGTHMVGADLRGSLINLASLAGADLRDSDLSGASFVGTSLASAKLSNSQLVGATLVGANLRGADLRGANLTDASLLIKELGLSAINSDPVWIGLNELTQQQLLIDADLSGIHFSSETEGFQSRSDIVELIGGHGEVLAGQEEGEPHLYLAVPPAIVQLAKVAYESMSTNVAVDIKSLATGGGVHGLCLHNDIEIIITDRLLNQEEYELCEANVHVVEERALAADAFVLVVPQSNNFVDVVTKEQVIKIFSRERWLQANPRWPGDVVQRFVPASDSAIYQEFAATFLPDGDDHLLDQGGFLARNTRFEENQLRIIEDVTRNKNNIGVASHANYFSNTESTRLVPIDGQEPTIETVANGEYPYVTYIYLYTLEEHLQDEVIAEFIDAFFAQVDAKVEDLGYFPLPRDLSQVPQSTRD